MNRNHVRRSAIPLVIALGLALAGCGGGDSGTDPQDDGNGGGGGGGGGGGPVATTAVTVSNNLFEPASIRVGPGVSVTWTWNSSGVVHNVTFASSSITNSGNRSSGTFTTAMPSAPGVYPYSCTLHAGMTGSVTVQ